MLSLDPYTLSGFLILGGIGILAFVLLAWWVSGLIVGDE